MEISSHLGHTRKAMMKSRKVKRDMLVCALVYIITPKTPALAFSIHSIVRSVQACHEKRSSTFIYSRMLDAKMNRISSTRIMRRRTLFLDDGPCVRLRRGESLGDVFLSRFPLLLSLKLSSSSQVFVAQMCICGMRTKGPILTVYRICLLFLPGKSTSGCTTRMCLVSASLRENVFSSTQ